MIVSMATVPTSRDAILTATSMQSSINPALRSLTKSWSHLSTSINATDTTAAVTTATHAVMESCRFPMITPGECRAVRPKRFMPNVTADFKRRVCGVISDSTQSLAIAS
jgi:hypothetical protein